MNQFREEAKLQEREMWKMEERKSQLYRVFRGVKEETNGAKFYRDPKTHRDFDEVRGQEKGKRVIIHWTTL